MTVTQIRQHRFTQGNMAGPQVDTMLAGERVFTLYSDPPWGDSYLKMFQTHTFKATGVRPAQINHAQLCARYADLVARYVTDYVFIETAHGCVPEMLEHLKPYLRDSRTQPFGYGNDLQGTIISGQVGDTPLPDIDVSGKKGLPFVKHILGHVVRPGAIILDPCCGAGYTARATDYHGMTFRGNELNPARLAKAIEYVTARK